MGGKPKRIPIPDEDLELFKFERAKRGDPKWVEWRWFKRSFTIRETRWRASRWRIPVYLFLAGVFFFWLPAVIGPLNYLWSKVSLYNPPENFDIEDLLVEESAFPPGWQTDPDGPRQFPGVYYAIARTQLFFYSEMGVAQQALRRFPDAEGWTGEFERQVALWFPEGEFSPHWHIPEAFEHVRFETDLVALGCALEAEEVCHFVAAYEPYVVRFTAPVGSAMSYAEFLNTTAEIEERLLHYRAVAATKAAAFRDGGEEQR